MNRKLKASDTRALYSITTPLLCPFSDHAEIRIDLRIEEDSLGPRISVFHT
ncbi:hypothetical protein WN48_00138 [Eufriesea mexicana]|uniref:Endonuclease/exonuclease/phosphatase domain-containing protein n=1 Tax=Eufriesea mexicana TaxID=516756 RepID=A0A310S8D5_9HYME|nr:hypothetical protein WN48_00138 [Eufriesea mexicana]